jgi:S13-like H2TH domain
VGVTPTPPSLTQEQRVQASRLAVANRRRRAEVKRLVKTGRMSLEEIFALAENEECVAQMRAYDLISALPAIGEVKAERIMAKAAIAKTRRIRGLGPKQRAELFRALVR